MKALTITFKDEEDADIVKTALRGECGGQLGECLRGILKRATLIEEKEVSENRRVGIEFKNGDVLNTTVFVSATESDIKHKIELEYKKEVKTIHFL